MFYVSRWKWWWSWWLHLYSLFIIFARLKTWHMDCRIKLNKLTNWIKVWKIEMTLTVQEQSRERGKKKEMMDGEFVRNDRSREKHDWKWMHHRQHPHPYCMKFLSKIFYWQNHGWKGMFTTFTVHEYWAYEALLQNSHIECDVNKFMIYASCAPPNKSVHCVGQTQNQWGPDSILLASPVENLKGPNLERIWKDVARGEYERRPAWRIWKQSHQRFQIPAPLFLPWLTKGPHL